MDMAKLFMLLMVLVARLGSMESLLLQLPNMLQRLLEEQLGAFQRYTSPCENSDVLLTIFDRCHFDALLYYTSSFMEKKTSQLYYFLEVLFSE
jgi:hypothetical protein